MMAFIARRSIFTQSVILTGWTPIIGAVIIEQPGGVVMSNALSNYEVMSTFQPLVNGMKSLIFILVFIHKTCKI
jgi:hypothetical protein